MADQQYERVGETSISSGSQSRRNVPAGRQVDLSIVIVNFNTAKITLECLESLRQYQPRCSHEVILVDNGSDDRIEEAAGRIFPGVRYIEVGLNAGFSRANNLGIYNSHGRYVLLLNSDTKLIEPTLDAMVEHLEDNPQTGVLGAREVDSDGKFQLSCGKFPTFLSEIIRKIWHYRLSINDYNVRDYLDSKHSGMKNVDWVSGSTLMLRREALFRSGMLDEGFFLYFEDIDLCRRIQEEGWAIQYLYEAKIVHYGGGSARQNLMKALTEYRSSQIFFTRKYYGVLGNLAIRALLISKFSFHFTRYTLTWLFKKLLGLRAQKTYTKALLAKKVIELAFNPLHRKSFEAPLRAGAPNS